MPLELLAKDLDTMKVQDLDGIRHIKVTDQENSTKERWERLRALVHQKEIATQAFAVNANELTEKLRQVKLSINIHPRPSPTPEPPTLEEELAEVYRRYNALLQMGGRPSTPINPDPGPCPPSKSDIDKDYHASDHIAGEEIRVTEELTRWEDFRKHQQRMRAPERFGKYNEDVRKFQEEKGIEWTVELQPEWQTKLDEWKEYYIYEYRKRRGWERKVERAERELESGQLELEEADLDPACLPKREAERIRKRLESHQNGLEAVKSDRIKEMHPGQKPIWIKRIQDSIESELQLLRAVESNDLELNLRKPLERHIEVCRGEVRLAKMDLEKVDTLLEWIKRQIPIVAVECAGSRQKNKIDHHHNPAWSRKSKPSTKTAQLSATSTRSKERRLTAQSVLGPMHSAKISKVTSKKRHQLSQESSTTRHEVSSSGNHAHGEHAVRRSERIAKRAPAPIHSSLSPINPSRVSKPSKMKLEQPCRQPRTSQGINRLPKRCAAAQEGEQGYGAANKALSQVNWEPPIPNVVLHSSERIRKLQGNGALPSSASRSLGRIHSSKVSKATRRTVS